MSEDRTGLEAMVAALVGDADAATREMVLERELALLRGARGPVRELVERRLRALAALPGADDRRIVDVEAMGRSLGMGRSATYRLLAKAAAEGPVTGLLPPGGVEARRSKARDGLGEVVDAVVRGVLENRPSASIAEVEAALDAALALMEPLDRPPAPRASALRGRVHFLRSVGATRIREDAVVGARLLVAACALDVLLVSGPDGGDAGFAAGLFVVDEPTSLVLGSAVYASNAPAALGTALLNARSTFTSLRRAGLTLSEVPRVVRWRVGPGLEGLAGAAVARARGSKDASVLDVVLERGAHPGADVVRHLGEHLPPFRFLPRVALPRPDAPADDAGRRDFRTYEALEADALLRRAVTGRNERIIGNAGPLPASKGGGADPGDRLTALLMPS